MIACFRSFFLAQLPPPSRQVKADGIKRIEEKRDRLIQAMWNESRHGKTPPNHAQWLRTAEALLDDFNLNLYKSFKEEFVRYPDIRTSAIADDSTKPLSDGRDAPKIRKRRHKNKGMNDRSENLWTVSSAVFFAATTMATIGKRDVP